MSSNTGNSAYPPKPMHEFRIVPPFTHQLNGPFASEIPSVLQPRSNTQPNDIRQRIKKLWHLYENGNLSSEDQATVLKEIKKLSTTDTYQSDRKFYKKLPAQGGGTGCLQPMTQTFIKATTDFQNYFQQSSQLAGSSMPANHQKYRGRELDQGKMKYLSESAEILRSSYCRQ
jgi:hypothetical protein